MLPKENNRNKNEHIEALPLSSRQFVKICAITGGDMLTYFSVSKKHFIQGTHYVSGSGLWVARFEIIQSSGRQISGFSGRSFAILRLFVLPST